MDFETPALPECFPGSYDFFGGTGCGVVLTPYNLFDLLELFPTYWVNKLPNEDLCYKVDGQEFVTEPSMDTLYITVVRICSLFPQKFPFKITSIPFDATAQMSVEMLCRMFKPKISDLGYFNFNFPVMNEDWVGGFLERGLSLELVTALVYLARAMDGCPILGPRTNSIKNNLYATCVLMHQNVQRCYDVVRHALDRLTRAFFDDADQDETSSGPECEVDHVVEIEEVTSAILDCAREEMRETGSVCTISNPPGVHMKPTEAISIVADAHVALDALAGVVTPVVDLAVDAKHAPLIGSLILDCHNSASHHFPKDGGGKTEFTYWDPKVPPMVPGVIWRYRPPDFPTGRPTLCLVAGPSSGIYISTNDPISSILNCLDGLLSGEFCGVLVIPHLLQSYRSAVVLVSCLLDIKYRSLRFKILNTCDPGLGYGYIAVAKNVDVEDAGWSPPGPVSPVSLFNIIYCHQRYSFVRKRALRVLTRGGPGYNPWKEMPDLYVTIFRRLLHYYPYYRSIGPGFSKLFTNPGKNVVFSFGTTVVDIDHAIKLKFMDFWNPLLDPILSRGKVTNVTEELRRVVTGPILGAFFALANKDEAGMLLYDSLVP